MDDRLSNELLKEVRAIRTDLSQIGEEMTDLRGEIARLHAALATGSAEAPQDAIRRLWQEGSASGIAGDLDEVFDTLLAGLPRSSRTA